MHPIERVINSRPSSAASLRCEPPNNPQDHNADDLSIAQELLNTAKHPGTMTSFTDTSFDRYDLEDSHGQSDIPDETSNLGRRKAIRSSMTWTSSIAEPHTQDQDDLEDRTFFAIEYNRLARKHGVPELLPEDYGPPIVSYSSAAVGLADENLWTDPANVSDKPGSWFSRKILRKTSSTQSVKHDKQLKHKRSFSDLSLRLKLRKNGLQDKKLQELVRVCGSSLLYLPTEYATGSLSVPTCFRATAQYLIQHAPTTRGVFRVPGSHSVVAASYNHYCDMDPDGHLIAGTVRCPTLPEHIKYDVHDVASTFKRFLSGVPGGILGSLTLFDSLVSIQTQLQGIPEMTRTKQSRIRARLIALSVSSLQSHYRRDLICTVFGLLCMIGRAAEIARREDDKGRPLPTSDLMGYGPLGIVFGPLLIGNMLDNYTIHVANPHENPILLPVSPPKSKKEKNKEKSNKGKGSGIDDCAIHNMQVDKLKIANGITEMLITHWRDVVRHLRSLSALNMSEGYNIVGTTSIKMPFLRPSVSESFALRKPPGWDYTKPQARDMDRSPTPTRQVVGLKGSHSQYFFQANDSLNVRKQRSKNLPSSGRMLSAAASRTALSPTVEERWLEYSPGKHPTAIPSTAAVERAQGSSGRVVAAAASKSAISPTRDERESGKVSWKSCMESSRTNTLQAAGGWSDKALATKTFKTIASPTGAELSADKSAHIEFAITSISDIPNQVPTAVVSSHDTSRTFRFRGKEYLPSKGLVNTSQAPVGLPHNPIHKTSIPTVPSNFGSGPYRQPTSCITADDGHLTSYKKSASSWSNDILFHMDINTEGFAHIEVQTPSRFDGSKSSKPRLDDKYHHTSTPDKNPARSEVVAPVDSSQVPTWLTTMIRSDIATITQSRQESEAKARSAQDMNDPGMEPNHIMELQQLSHSPTCLSPLKIPIRRAFPPVAGLRNYGLVRRTPASEPELRQSTPFTADSTPSSIGRRRKAFTGPAQFATWVDPLAKVSDKDDKASLAALAQALELVEPANTEMSAEIVVRGHFSDESRSSDGILGSRDLIVHDDLPGQPVPARVEDWGYTGSVDRTLQKHSEAFTMKSKEKTITRSSFADSTRAGSQAEVDTTPQTPLKSDLSIIIQGSGRVVGKVRALAAKFDAAKSISPSDPPMSRLPTVSSVGVQGQLEQHTESLVALYKTNLPSPAKSQKSARNEKTPVRNTTPLRPPVAPISKSTPRRSLNTSNEDATSIRSLRNSSETTVTPSGRSFKHPPDVTTGKAKSIQRASVSAYSASIDYDIASSRGPDTPIISQTSYGQKEFERQSSKSVQRSQTSEIAQSVKRGRKQHSDATILQPATSHRTSDTYNTLRPLPSCSTGRNVSVLYDEIRQIQRQLRGLEDENLLLRQQLETRESDVVHRLRDKLRDITSNLKHWKARAESAEKEMDIITKLASRNTPAQTIKNPTALNSSDSLLPKRTYNHDGAQTADHLSTTSFYGLDGAGSHYRSSGSDRTVIRDQREAVFGLDYTIWLDPTVFDADPDVPNRLGSIGL